MTCSNANGAREKKKKENITMPRWLPVGLTSNNLGGNCKVDKRLPVLSFSARSLMHEESYVGRQL